MKEKFHEIIYDCIASGQVSSDRIDNKKNYEKGNVQFVTNMYNKLKGFYKEKEIDEFCYKRVERLKNG